MDTNELSDLQKKVLYEGYTERPFSGTYDQFFEKGIYIDPITGKVLFSSLDKFDAGCGWPAFSKPVETNAVKETLDTSLGMERTEVKSESSNGHLGHVFADGPKDTGGLRYCINSAALTFIPYEQLEEQGYTEYKKIFDQ